MFKQLIVSNHLGKKIFVNNKSIHNFLLSPSSLKTTTTVTRRIKTNYYNNTKNITTLRNNIKNKKYLPCFVSNCRVISNVNYLQQYQASNGYVTTTMASAAAGKRFAQERAVPRPKTGSRRDRGSHRRQPTHRGYASRCNDSIAPGARSPRMT